MSFLNSVFEKEKCYDPRDSTVKLVDGDDEFDCK